MSHTSNLEVRVKNKSLLLGVCNKLGLKICENTKVSFFSTSEQGTSIQLKGWKYPVVIRPDGTLVYDNFNGTWGNMSELHKFVQTYAVEGVKLECIKKGFSVSQHLKENKEIELEITIDRGL
jgi:hypothetical protein